MLNYVIFNIKSSLKRKENVILVLLFVICEIALLFTLNTKIDTESPYQQSLGISSSNVTQKLDSELYKEFMNLVNLTNDEIEKGELAAKNKDWKLYCEYKVKVSVLEAQWYILTSNEEISYFEHSNIIEKLRKKYHIEDLSKYQKIIGNKSNENINLYFCSQQAARYFDYLLDYNLTPITYSFVDSSSVLLQISRYIFPIVLPLVVGLLLFQQKERRIKTEKMILTVSGMKKKYITWNLISDYVLILLIVFLPIVLYVVGLTLVNGISNFNYPVLYYHSGLTGFNYWDTMGLDNVSLVASGLTNMSVNQFCTPGMEIMPLWQCSLLIGFGIILLIFFYVVFICLLSETIKNKYLALLIFLVTLGLLSFASPIGNTQMINTLNPMSYRDFGMNLLGTSYFGYFAGIAVLAIYCIVMYLVLKWCAKKVHA